MNAKFGGAPPAEQARRATTRRRPASPRRLFKAPIAGGMDLGRPLCRRQHRLRLAASPAPTPSSAIAATGSSAVRDQRLSTSSTARSAASRAATIGVAGNLARRHRRRHLNYSGQRASHGHVCPGDDLQSGARRLSTPPVTGDFRARPETGVVRHAARTPRRNRHARCPGLCHRRPGGRRDHDRRHRVRLRRRRQSGQHHRQQPQHQGGLDGRRRPRGPPGRQLDRARSNTSTRFRHGLDRAVTLDRTRRSRSPSIRASPTTSCASGVNYKFNPNEIWAND